MRLAQGHNTVSPQHLGLESSTLPLSHCVPLPERFFLKVNFEISQQTKTKSRKITQHACKELIVKCPMSTN